MVYFIYSLFFILYFIFFFLENIRILIGLVEKNEVTPKTATTRAAISHSPAFLV